MKSRLWHRGVQEALFAANFTCALCYGLVMYVMQGGLSYPPSNDSGYYFLRGVVRFADLMHFGASNAVSTHAVARNGMPIIMNKLAICSTFLVSLCALYFVILFLIRIGRRLFDEGTLGLVSGVVAVFAAPGFCLLGSKLSYNVSAVSTVPGSSFLPTVLCGEIFGFFVLTAWARRRSISVWIVGVLLLLHFGFWSWIVVGANPGREFRETFGLLFYFCLLLWLIPSVIAAWLEFLLPARLSSPQERRIGKWSVIAGAIGLVVLLAIWWPTRGYSLTKAKDFRTAVIELSRGPCYGMCPSYTVTIHGDGSVEYVGGRLARRDAQAGNIGVEAVSQILRQLDEVHFSTLEDRAFSWCFDSSSVSITVSVDGRSKRVVSDAGCTGAKSGLQSRFVRVAGNIDEIVGSERWVRCVDRPCRQ